MKFLLWNLQDFFVFLDKYDPTKIALSDMSEPHWQIASSSFKPNKPLDKVQAIADFITTISPDICLFTEVGGKESLENLNTYFLQNKYRVLHFPSNSDRGIDLGILIEKSSTNFQTRFHNNSVYARGVHELRLPWGEKQLCILLTHLKSKLNKEGKDFEGRSKRKKEVDTMIKLAQKRIDQGNEVIIAGDLNGVIYGEESEPELASFANILGLYDVLEHAQVPDFERATYLYYNKGSEMVPMQLDYFLMSKKLFKSVDIGESGVRDFEGNERCNFPISLKEKNAHPSDHYPIIVKLDK